MPVMVSMVSSRHRAARMMPSRERLVKMRLSRATGSNFSVLAGMTTRSVVRLKQRM